ncbi:hypothetical protein SLEP1_g22703 [Rubroshorea leprosula]|uniref:Uncharacterized protein n=1 Tax=Rubroshorea leprosula TaxID=152421 RepID=A0AAV5JD00_9ROSI|nr:hypothetical protein SLEP1_g22703 [Rubroshorea leprosula]
MNKFLDAAPGVRIPKKKSKVAKVIAEVGRRDGRSFTHSTDTLALVISQPRSVEAKSTKVPPSGGKGYIHASTASYYEPGMRSMAKRFINTYFLDMNCQWAKDEVENAKLVQKKEEVKLEKAKLLSELNKLREENAILKRDSGYSFQKRRICKDELKKKENELDEVRKVAIKLELQVHNSAEVHITKFWKSSTFDNIINLYQLPTVIVTFSDCRKKVKLQYPEVDVTKVTFRD